MEKALFRLILVLVVVLGCKADRDFVPGLFGLATKYLDLQPLCNVQAVMCNSENTDIF
jgi:hypothetical protein